MAKVRTGGKYNAEQIPEAQFEPGSRGRVLKNLLSIKHKREMNQVEARELRHAVDELIQSFDQRHRFTERDIRRMHATWLDKVYAWAGKYRNVNLVKGDFPFAAAREVPRLMLDFERGPLRQFTPCRFPSHDEIAMALAVVHTEFILIHPFREGNGRIGRLLAVLMALQAGLPPLDFGAITGRKRLEYFAAVQAGMDRNYKPMEKVFSDVIRRTLKRHVP
jgi:cell filamentation protein, protein adenylyltransferase